MSCYGIYIVNSDFDVIYIDWCNDIFKIDLKIFILFFKKSYFKMRLICVYWLIVIGDLLVGVYSLKLNLVMIFRFNEVGRMI